jgi:hypothetical protein
MSFCPLLLFAFFNSISSSCLFGSFFFRFSLFCSCIYPLLCTVKSPRLSSHFPFSLLQHNPPQHFQLYTDIEKHNAKVRAQWKQYYHNLVQYLDYCAKQAESPSNPAEQQTAPVRNKPGPKKGSTPSTTKNGGRKQSNSSDDDSDDSFSASIQPQNHEPAMAPPQPPQARLKPLSHLIPPTTLAFPTLAYERYSSISQAHRLGHYLDFDNDESSLPIHAFEFHERFLVQKDLQTTTLWTYLALRDLCRLQRDGMQKTEYMRHLQVKINSWSKFQASGDLTDLHLPLAPYTFLEQPPFGKFNPELTNATENNGAETNNNGTPTITTNNNTKCTGANNKSKGAVVNKNVELPVCLEHGIKNLQKPDPRDYAAMIDPDLIRTQRYFDPSVDRHGALIDTDDLNKLRKITGNKNIPKSDSITPSQLRDRTLDIASLRKLCDEYDEKCGGNLQIKQLTDFQPQTTTATMNDEDNNNVEPTSTQPAKGKRGSKAVAVTPTTTTTTTTTTTAKKGSSTKTSQTTSKATTTPTPSTETQPNDESTVDNTLSIEDKLWKRLFADLPLGFKDISDLDGIASGKLEAECIDWLQHFQCNLDELTAQKVELYPYTGVLNDVSKLSWNFLRLYPLIFPQKTPTININTDHNSNKFEMVQPDENQFTNTNPPQVQQSCPLNNETSIGQTIEQLHQDPSPLDWLLNSNVNVVENTPDQQFLQTIRYLTHISHKLRHGPGLVNVQTIDDLSTVVDQIPDAPKLEYRLKQFVNSIDPVYQKQLRRRQREKKAKLAASQGGLNRGRNNNNSNSNNANKRGNNGNNNSKKAPPRKKNSKRTTYDDDASETESESDVASARHNNNNNDDGDDEFESDDDELVPLYIMNNITKQQSPFGFVGADEFDDAALKATATKRSNNSTSKSTTATTNTSQQNDVTRKKRRTKAEMDEIRKEQAKNNPRRCKRNHNDDSNDDDDSADDTSDSDSAEVTVTKNSGSNPKSKKKPPPQQAMSMRQQMQLFAQMEEKEKAKQNTQTGTTQRK